MEQVRNPTKSLERDPPSSHALALSLQSPVRIDPVGRIDLGYTARERGGRRWNSGGGVKLSPPFSRLFRNVGAEVQSVSKLFSSVTIIASLGLDHSRCSSFCFLAG